MSAHEKVKMEGEKEPFTYQLQTFWNLCNAPGTTKWQVEGKQEGGKPNPESRFVGPERDCTIPLFPYAAMPTDLPYAADAEVSLSYDELEVRNNVFQNHQHLVD